MNLIKVHVLTAFPFDCPPHFSPSSWASLFPEIQYWNRSSNNPTMGFLDGSAVKNLPTKQEIWVQSHIRSQSQENLLEKEIATQSSILAWDMPWTKKSGGLQSMGSQRVGHNSVQEAISPSEVKGRVSRLNLNKKPGIIKLSEESMLKIKMGWKLGLLCQLAKFWMQRKSSWRKCEVLL